MTSQTIEGPAMTLSRRRSIALLAAGAAMPLPSLAMAQDVAAVEAGTHTATMAARLARGACFAALEIDAARHFAMLDHARAVLADTRLTGEVAALWTGLHPHVETAVAEQTLPDPRVAAIAEGAAALQNAALAAARQNAGGTVGALMAAGELRALVQALAALAAQGTLGLPQAGPELEGTRERAEGQLARLRDVPGTSELQEALAALEPLWQDYRRVLDGVALIGLASGFELTAIAAQADPLDGAVQAVAAAVANA